MSLLNKFQVAAQKAGKQATAFSSQVLSQAEESSKQFQGGFTLERECERASKTIQSFLADPNHPQSALNSIPKAVLRKAKGLAIFTVVKAGVSLFVIVVIYSLSY